jgi:hypothetical protein
MPASFDPSRQLDLYFRVNRVGSKVFNFVDSNGSAYTINGNTFQFILKDALGNGIFTLTSGNGLTIGTSSVTVAVTANQTNIAPAGYVWELYLSNLGKTWLSGNAYFHSGVFDGVTSTSSITIDDADTVTVTISDSSGVSAATQSEVNTGTETAKYVSPATLQDRDDMAVALVDGATIDLTGPKHTLSTATGRTFTISHAGDCIIIDVTLSATSATFTFPATATCVYAGTASGDNTLAVTGATSGDHIMIGIIKVGSNYRVTGVNFGQ